MAATAAPPAPAQAPLALRAAFFGPRARDWLCAWVEEVPLAELEAPAPGRALDALVIDPRAAAADPDQAATLKRRARRLGAGVLSLPDGEGPAAVRPFDWRVFNPLGFRPSDVAGFAAATSRAPSPAARTLLSEVAGDEPVVLFTELELASDGLPAGVLRTSPPEGGEPAVAEAMNEQLGALDHPSFHGDDADRAAWLARLCASGVPVAASDLSPALERLLGEELAGTLAGVGPEQLADLDRRERVSVDQRRAALRTHSLDARWRQLAAAAGIELPDRPKVSAILSTRRQSWLSWGLEQYARQTYQPRELVVCLHGDDFSEGVEEQVRREVQGPVQVIHVASELTLGDALNQGVEVATGDYVTKMDDDDYYSADHLWDLVFALAYSGADLAGKAAEFVYLEEIDVTIRQLTRDVETRLAGGGMMLRREPLRELGGWPSLSRGEDLAIVRHYEANGRRIHRTNPHGYILNRHGRDHTWRPYVDYFLFRSGRQWRGLRLDQTGIA